MKEIKLILTDINSMSQITQDSENLANVVNSDKIEISTRSSEPTMINLKELCYKHFGEIFDELSNKDSYLTILKQNNSSLTGTLTQIIGKKVNDKKFLNEKIEKVWSQNLGLQTLDYIVNDEDQFTKDEQPILCLLAPKFSANNADFLDFKSNLENKGYKCSCVRLRGAENVDSLTQINEDGVPYFLVSGQHANHVNKLNQIARENHVEEAKIPQMFNSEIPHSQAEIDTKENFVKYLLSTITKRYADVEQSALAIQKQTPIEYFDYQNFIEHFIKNPEYTVPEHKVQVGKFSQEEKFESEKSQSKESSVSEIDKSALKSKYLVGQNVGSMSLSNDKE